MKDIENVDDIKTFVDGFYQKVQRDMLLGPIFLAAIPGDWQPHLDKMYAFWNAALFSVPGFRGNPFAKHAPLRIKEEHFDRWLELFDETINTAFSGEMAEDAKRRARLMAQLFLIKLQSKPDGYKGTIV